MVGQHVTLPADRDANAPLIDGVKATSKTRRAVRAALTPTAARTDEVRGGSKTEDMAHQD